MKRFSAGVVVGLLAGWVVALGATVVEHNGLYWGHLDSTAKSGYVNGYADAMQVSVGKLDNLTVAADLFHWKGAKKIIRQLSHELSVSEVKPDDVVRRLDDLYSNRKYSELDLGSALQLLTMRASEPLETATGTGTAAPASPTSHAAPGHPASK
jgi:hypothetical protein